MIPTNKEILQNQIINNCYSKYSNKNGIYMKKFQEIEKQKFYDSLKKQNPFPAQKSSRQSLKIPQNNEQEKSNNKENSTILLTEIYQNAQKKPKNSYFTPVKRIQRSSTTQQIQNKENIKLPIPKASEAQQKLQKQQFVPFVQERSATGKLLKQDSVSKQQSLQNLSQSRVRCLSQQNLNKQSQNKNQLQQGLDIRKIKNRLNEKYQYDDQKMNLESKVKTSEKKTDSSKLINNENTIMGRIISKENLENETYIVKDKSYQGNQNMISSKSEEKIRKNFSMRSRRDELIKKNHLGIQKKHSFYLNSQYQNEAKSQKSDKKNRSSTTQASQSNNPPIGHYNTSIMSDLLYNKAPRVFISQTKNDRSIIQNLEENQQQKQQISKEKNVKESPEKLQKQILNSSSLLLNGSPPYEREFNPSKDIRVSKQMFQNVMDTQMNRYTYVKQYSAKLDYSFNDHSFDKFRNDIVKMKNKINEISHNLQEIPVQSIKKYREDKDQQDQQISDQRKIRDLHVDYLLSKREKEKPAYMSSYQ